VPVERVEAGPVVTGERSLDERLKADRALHNAKGALWTFHSRAARLRRRAGRRASTSK